MNKYFLTAAAAFLAIFPAFAQQQQEVTINPPKEPLRTFNSDTSKGYGASQVIARLNVNVKDDTNRIHFIRDTTDPFVVTKAYLIKNANVWILRGVLKTIVSGSLVNSPVQMDSVMYNDGVGVLLVSAEEYRFKNAGNGMSMDELVASLDRKNLPNSSGTIDMAYFPKYNPASTMLSLMVKSGIGFTQASQTAKDWTVSGVDLSTDPDKLSYAAVDNKMNVIVMTAAGYDVKEALRFLKDVDNPIEEIRISYKLIEVYAENDQKLGLDFQAWKNNDGIDLFSAGGKYGTNWGNGGLTPNAGYRYAEYYNFNPKWNSKYIDFLTVCSKAKVVSSGSLVVANGHSANLTLADGLFSIVTKDIKDSTSTETQKKTTIKTDENGVTTATTEIIEGSKDLIPWTLSALLPSTEADGYYAGRVQEIPAQALNHNVREGKTQEVEVADGNLFQLAVAGDVHGKASNLSIALASTSVIGWDGQGRARLTKSSYKTQIQINSDKKEFVIGGLTKCSVVRSVSGFPILKDLPGLGWLFSTETDTVKKSQFVLVATAEVVKNDASLTREEKTKFNEINTTVGKAVKNPMGTLGFQQLLIDTKEWK